MVRELGKRYPDLSNGPIPVARSYHGRTDPLTLDSEDDADDPLLLVIPPTMLSVHAVLLPS